MTGATNGTKIGSNILNSFLTTWDKVSIIEGIVAIVLFLITVYLLWILILKYLWFQGKRSIKIIKNLQRKVYFASSLPGGRLQTEIDIFSENGFYNIHKTSIDINTNPTYFTHKKNIAIVIEYDASFVHYPTLVQEARNNNFAIIVYSKNPTAITQIHKDLFQTYPYFEMCNSVGRTLSSLYNLLSIMPYGQK